jgi:hypothetical protein
VDIFAILEGLISSVPEALALYQKVATLIAPAAGVTDAQIAEVAALAPAAHAAVDVAHQAIGQLISAHGVTPPANLTSAAPAAPAS